MSRSPDITHKIMSAVKSKDTRPEVTLRKELFRRGLRFRKNMKALRGKPDIVFTRVKLVVFCDGDFWHGHNWAIRGYGSFEQEMERYSPQWADKIRNMQMRVGRYCEFGKAILRRMQNPVLTGLNTHTGTSEEIKRAKVLK